MSTLTEINKRVVAANARYTTAMQRLRERMTAAKHARATPGSWALTAAAAALEEARAAVLETDAALRALVDAYEAERKLARVNGMHAVGKGEEVLATLAGPAKS